jgi:uncharacterized damage-inducible protein DinB
MSRTKLMMGTVAECREEPIGRWLWAFEDVRRVLKRLVQDMSLEELDWRPEGGSSTGSLLYHIAAIEADWLYFDVLGARQFPPDMETFFSYEVRDEDGRLTAVVGETIDQHLHRLDAVREATLAVFRQMDLADWQRARKLPEYDMTPAWALYHLIEHEAHHRGQIAMLRSLYRRQAQQ